VAAPRSSGFVSWLAVHGRVAPSTQNQALAAILFLYRHVLEINLPWLEGVTRAARPRHIPVVLTREETRRVLAELQGHSLAGGELAVWQWPAATGSLDAAGERSGS